MVTRRADHFDFLDGIRAVSAFYVLLTHAYNLLFYAGIGSGGVRAHRLIFGLAAMSLILYCVESLPREWSDSQPLVLRILRAKWLVALDTFSYSFYLVHYPFVELSG